MKKIIKITALVLALICIGTSCAACGKSSATNEEMAITIQNSMIIKKYRKYYIEYEGTKTSNKQEFYAYEIFNPNGKSLSDTGKTINRPIDFQKDYKVSINQEERKIVINFHTQITRLWKEESCVFEICLPCKVKSTNKGIISDDKNVVILEYDLDNIKTRILTNAIGYAIYTNEEMWEEDGYAVIDEIIIKY